MLAIQERRPLQYEARAVSGQNEETTQARAQFTINQEGLPLAKGFRHPTRPEAEKHPSPHIGLTASASDNAAHPKPCDALDFQEVVPDAKAGRGTQLQAV